MRKNVWSMLQRQPQRRQAAVEAASWAMLSDVPVALIWVRLALFLFTSSSSLKHLIGLGLPAFKPGEKVEIDFGMDDV